MNEINALLDKVKLIIKYNSNLFENDKTYFNIFHVCGVNHYENSHSSIIAEFLKTDGTHGFKEKFLKAFLDVLISEKIIDNNFNFSCSNVKVKTEYVINNGRIDIFITNNEKQAIIIENKIYADDQLKQLERYSNYGKQEFKQNFLLLYLTLFGDEASEQSSQKVEYKQISYNYIIIEWLERCVEISARNAVVRETLIQYINYIKKLTGQDMKTQSNDELIEFLSKKENIQATLLIGQNMNAVINNVVNKVFIPQLTDVCNELNLVNISSEEDWFNESWAGFQIKNPDWKYFKIALEFGAKGLRNCIIGFNHINVEERNDKTFDELKKLMRRNNSNWAWNDFPKYTSWGKDAIIAILNGEMAEIFKTEIKKLLDITEKLTM